MVDVTHSLVLNLIRSELKHHLLKDLGGNAGLQVVNRVPEVGVLLRLVLWNTELRDGRFPQVCQSEPTGKETGRLKSQEVYRSI